MRINKKAPKGISKTFGKFLKDTGGSMALTWVLTGLGTIMAVGSAYDMSQLAKAKQMSQLAADNLALAASIAVDTDNDDRFKEGKKYGYESMGGPSKDFTNSLKGYVNYDVDDDGDGVGNLLARATVTGAYQPAFLSAFGVEGIAFGATSDVAYAQRQGTPASIFFVTDNSGSMNSRDDNRVVKIDSLKTSMISFMTILKGIDTHGDKIFRTGLIPYSSDIINSKVVNPKWNVLTNNSINLMRGSGGTKSTNALKKAKEKFALENTIHKNKNGEANPLKFLIFMSDGANNGVRQRNVCSVESEWVAGRAEYWVDTYRNWNTVYNSYQNWFDRWVVHYPARSGGYEDVETCVQVPYSPVNEASLAYCETMKSQNVQIYSIAYDVEASERAMAEDFMRKCSSNTANDVYTDNGFYKYARSGSDLQAVFDAIGESVVKEVIRIKR